ncbi:hypothetical protein Hanom_Chr16g01511381 [Helianthus anomalus]
MEALYFISCARDAFLVVYFARVCIGYHCCLVLFVITVYLDLLFRIVIFLGSYMSELGCWL